MEIIRWFLRWRIDKEDVPRFPPEVFYVIATHCDISIIPTLKQVCREWSQILDHESVWQRVVKKVNFFSLLVFGDKSSSTCSYKEYARVIQENFFGDRLSKLIYKYAKQQELMETLKAEANKSGRHYFVGEFNKWFDEIQLQKLMKKIDEMNKEIGDEGCFKSDDLKQYFGDLWLNSRPVDMRWRGNDYVDYITEGYFRKDENVIRGITNGYRDFYSIYFRMIELDFPLVVTLFQRYTNDNLIFSSTRCRKFGLETGSISFMMNAKHIQVFKALMIFGKAKCKIKGVEHTLSFDKEIDSQK